MLVTETGMTDFDQQPSGTATKKKAHDEVAGGCRDLDGNSHVVRVRSPSSREIAAQLQIRPCSDSRQETILAVWSFLLLEEAPELSDGHQGLCAV